MEQHHQYRQQRLMEFIRQPTSLTFLAYLTDQASKVISCHDAATYKNNNTNSSSSSSALPALTEFVDFIVCRSSVGPGTLLAALVLLDRLRHRLAPVAKKGMPCTCQRIFLATLVVTSKLLNDTAPRNGHWMHYAHYFTVAEINLMEKQLLALLDFQLSITLNDLYVVLARFDNAVAAATAAAAAATSIVTAADHHSIVHHHHRHPFPPSAATAAAATAAVAAAAAAALSPLRPPSSRRRTSVQI